MITNEKKEKLKKVLKVISTPEELIQDLEEELDKNKKDNGKTLKEIEEQSELARKEFLSKKLPKTDFTPVIELIKEIKDVISDRKRRESFELSLKLLNKIKDNYGGFIKENENILNGLAKTHK